LFVFQAISSQDVPWFEGCTVEIDEMVFAIQPEKSICRKCGRAIDAEANIDDKEQFLKECKTNRLLRAEVIILGEVEEGRLPKAFKPRMVKSSTSFWQCSTFALGMVRKERFAGHLAVNPDDCEGQKAPDQMIDYIDAEGQPRTGVAVSRETPLPSQMPITSTCSGKRRRRSLRSICRCRTTSRRSRLPRFSTGSMQRL